MFSTLTVTQHDTHICVELFILKIKDVEIEANRIISMKMRKKRI